MANPTYKELPIEVGGIKLAYKRVINPSELGKDTIDLNQESTKVNVQIDKYCAYLAEAPHIRPEVAKRLFSRLLKVRREINESSNKPKTDRVNVLSEANFKIHSVHADIAREQKFNVEKSGLSSGVRFLGATYFVIIITLIVVGWVADVGMTEMPVLGIPLSVLLWSAIGSLAAILYRFYKHQITDLVQVELEVNWLIARPVLGIIMGIVSYLLIIAGLFVFGSATPVGDQSTKPQLLWVAAFLAGFSDKFWEGFIAKLVGRDEKTDK